MEKERRGKPEGEDTTDLEYKPKSCNMGIWFDGTLSRQLINENIIDSPANGRTFTIYRYDESFINGTKSNPSSATGARSS